MTRIKTSYWTLVGFYVNGLIDDGENIFFERIKEVTRNKNLLNFLKEKYPNDIDLSLFKKEEIEQMNEVFERIGDAVYNRERRKFGVEKNGLCLVMAYVLECLQNQDGYDH